MNRKELETVADEYATALEGHDRRTCTEVLNEDFDHLSYTEKQQMLEVFKELYLATPEEYVANLMADGHFDPDYGEDDPDEDVEAID